MPLLRRARGSATYPSSSRSRSSSATADSVSSSWLRRKTAHWHEAYDHGDVKFEGSPEILKLIANVVGRQEERARTRKVH